MSPSSVHLHSNAFNPESVVLPAIIYMRLLFTKFKRLKKHEMWKFHPQEIRGYTVLHVCADRFWLALCNCYFIFPSLLSFLYCLQIVGHMFAYPVVYDLVADSNEEKQEVADVLESIIGQYA